MFKFFKRWSRNAEFSYLCSCCRERHFGLPDLAYASPVYWNETDPSEPGKSQLSTDLCVIDGVHYFIRAVLCLPITGTEHRLGWSVWVSQSKANFDLYAETFGATPERVTFGYLANDLPSYPETLNMPTQLHWQTNGQRPWVEPEASDHPLYRDWVNGISRERAIEFAQLALHPDQ